MRAQRKLSQTRCDGNHTTKNKAAKSRIQNSFKQFPQWSFEETYFTAATADRMLIARENHKQETTCAIARRQEHGGFRMRGWY